MLFGRRKVDEDLERIRVANLSPEKMAEEKTRQEELKKKTQALTLEKGDIPAMIIAVFSVIMPYVLIFLGVMGVAYFLVVQYLK